MKKILENLYFSFFYEYKKNKSIYIFSSVVLILGFIIGIIISFTNINSDYILSLSNKNYMDFVKGTADLNSIFVENFKWVLIGNLICILFSFTIFTFSLALVYISYQSAILAITIVTIIKNFRFLGVLNSLFFILPFNLCIILGMSLLSSILYSFFKNNKKFGVTLFDTKEDKFIFIKLIIIFLVEVLVCFILSYFVPITLKSLIIVSF